MTAATAATAATAETCDHLDADRAIKSIIAPYSSDEAVTALIAGHARSLHDIVPDAAFADYVRLAIITLPAIGTRTAFDNWHAARTADRNRLLAQYADG